MATKINPDFYGAENTFVTLSSSQYAKRCSSSIGGLMQGGIYTGGSFDTTASPWGIGASSVSSDFYFLATKGDIWTINSGGNNRKNTPFYLYWNSSNIEGNNDPSDLLGSSASPWYYARALYKDRVSPDAVVSGSELQSTMTLDANSRIDLPNTVTQYPVTYADYQHLRVVIGTVFYKPKNSNTNAHTTMTAIKAGSVEVDKIISFYFSVVDTDNHNTGIQMSIGGSELDIPEMFRTCYYGTSEKWVRPWRRIASCGYWYYGVYDTSVTFYSFNSNYAAYTSAYETPTASDVTNDGRPSSNAWGHLSDKIQVFDDVSYHWNYGLSTYSSNQWDINDVSTGDTYVSGMYRSYAYMDIDGDPDNDAYYSAILHEVAFLGLPIVADGAYIADAIGSDNVYLPIFDDHMVTTGEYVSGAAAAQQPNASWTDIFGVDMPDYDPEYEPEPVPEVSDYGDTSNLGSPRGIFPHGVNIYLMSANEYNTFIGELNSYYANSTPDDWTLDFQGVNPADYILAAYYTPYNFVKSENKSAVKIGNITLTTTSYTLSQGQIGVDPPNKWKYFKYGTRKVTPLFGDFRDYEPYTKVELYLPLAGTVELETSYVMNHNITIEYYFDVMTMSGVAAVYRDNMLYKCSDFKLGCQLPVLSTNMGSIQNHIVQLEASQKANSMRLAAGALTAAGGIAATIATGGAALPAMVAAGTGALSLATGMQRADDLNYQLDHSAPSVSQTGAAEPMNNYSVGQLMPKLIIKRPLMLSTLNNSIYAHTIGHACCINDIIGNMTGLTVCSKIDTSGINATVEEIQAIKQAFANGVYV